MKWLWCRMVFWGLLCFSNILVTLIEKHVMHRTGDAAWSLCWVIISAHFFSEARKEMAAKESAP